MLTQKKKGRHEKAAALPANFHADPPTKRGGGNGGGVDLPASSGQKGGIGRVAVFHATTQTKRGSMGRLRLCLRTSMLCPREKKRKKNKRGKVNKQNNLQQRYWGSSLPSWSMCENLLAIIMVVLGACVAFLVPVFSWGFVCFAGVLVLQVKAVFLGRAQMGHLSVPTCTELEARTSRATG